MKRIRYTMMVLGILLSPAVASAAQVSVGIRLPGASIGINVPAYPYLVPMPGYPVYYAPRLDANFFFYDGMYWIYQDDNWYASSWYNGPWGQVYPEGVPLFILRIPVRYYRRPPAYFYGWRPDAPPHWGDYWGRDWEQHRSGWDKWNRNAAPAPAPLPAYQRQYSGNRYPQHMEQQYELQQQHYRYQPHDPVVQQRYQRQGGQSVPQQGPQRVPEMRDSRQPENQRVMPNQPGGVSAPRPASPQQAYPPVRDDRQPTQPKPAQQMQRSQGNDITHEPKQGQGQGQGQQKGRDRDENQP